jgi:hypothetical protein
MLEKVGENKMIKESNKVCPKCKGKLLSNSKLDKEISKIDKMCGIKKPNFVDLYCLSCLVRFTYIDGEIVSAGDMGNGHLNYFKEKIK